MDQTSKLLNARVFVSDWAKNRQVRATDFDTIYLDFNDLVAAHNYANPKKKVRPISKALLESAFNEFLRSRPAIIQAQLADKFTCVKEDLEPVKVWVKAVTGKCDDDDLYVIAHWLWQVKRNALHYKVVHHIMPLIVSPKQGGGKSTAVNRLIEPYNELSLELKVPQIVDERSFTMFSNYLIGFLDELSGADKVEINEFKRNLTSGTLTYRPMRTNSQEKITNLCSFIGSSNNAIYDIIKDTTGIRRFFSIRALDRLDHASINSIDYELLWRGVNEKLERGYIERVSELVASKQDSMTMKDEVTLFLEHFNILPKDDDILVEVNGKHLFDEYIINAKNNNVVFRDTSQKFYKRLKDIGLSAVYKRDNRKIMRWFFAINSDHALGKEGMQ